MLIEVIPGGAFVENTYLIKGDESIELILVDPGSQIPEIEEVVTKISFDKMYIVNTHAHLDHVYGVEYFKKKYNANFYLHKNELPVLDAMISASMRFGLEEFSDPVIPKVDFFIEDEEELKMAGLAFKTILIRLGVFVFIFKLKRTRKKIWNKILWFRVTQFSLAALVGST